jgi:hypothetical protein
MTPLTRLKLERIYGSVVQWFVFTWEVLKGLNLAIKQAWRKWQ